VEFIPANGDAATIEYRFPAGDGVFRIILADRIGVITIDALTFLAGERELWRREAPGAVVNPGFETVALDEGRTYALVRPDAWIEPQLPIEVGASADRVCMTLRWTGDWSGAAALAALTGLSGVFSDRMEATHREIARLHTLIDARDRALEARGAEISNAKAELSEERRIGRQRQTLRGWLAVPFARVRALFARGPR
jgi:hypothetical protein